MLDPDKIYALSEAINDRIHVFFHEEKQTNDCQGLLLGADFEKDLLLFGDFHPSPLYYKKLRRGTAFSVRVKSEDQFLNIDLISYKTEYGLLYAHIVRAEWSDNRRWHERIRFGDRKGPKVSILREFSPNLDCHLRDLSIRGAAFDIWGQDLRKSFVTGQDLATHLVFNSSFVMYLNANVVSSQFIRSPCCHTRLRVQFNCLDEVQLSQLLNLIECWGASKHAA